MSDSEKREHVKGYVKSEIRVSSVEYKKILREVSEKRREIEKKEAEIKCLKEELQNHRYALENAAIFRTTTSTDSTTTKTTTVTFARATSSCCSPEQKLTSAASINDRTAIITPGGTKRKVKPSHMKFKVDLQDTLHKFVCKKPDACVRVDDLIEKLVEKFPGVKGFERMHILRTISKLYDTKIEYRGKKREGFYRGLGLIEDTGLNTTEKSQADESTVKQTKVRRSLLLQSPDVEDNVISDVSPDVEDNVISDVSPDVEDNVISDVSPDVEDNVISDVSMRIQELSVEDEHQYVDELSKKLDCVQSLLAQYETSVQHTIKKQDEVISLYKDILDSGSLLGGLLSLTERREITDEVKKVKKIFNLNMRTNEVIDLADVFDPSLFQNMVIRIKEECPTIANILEQLVLSSNASRNVIKTENMKMKAAVHLLASLIDVRDQNSKNDVPILFGLLCLCYGAGPSMIEVLQHLGLSESFPVLIRILQSQIQNYKAIILKRVDENKPVITYQDNMQLMRTSMRHLRLSKLQKDKMKQGKVWDFTVRGWRDADITGLEEMFKDSEQATQSQRAVKELKYEDTKIENNPEHNEKWKAFKKRNMLRKLDVGLNSITVSKEDVLSATSEELMVYGTAAEKQTTPRKFVVEVPPVAEEFPDLGKKKTNIYPLPISHENQCKTVGVASNLQLFSEEFGFKCEQVKCYLPMRSSGNSFDLDKAYQRFAFMKSLEKHKEQQAKYEQLLRGEKEVMLENHLDQDDSEIHTHVFVMESESSDSGD